MKHMQIIKQPVLLIYVGKIINIIWPERVSNQRRSRVAGKLVPVTG